MAENKLPNVAQLIRDKLLKETPIGHQFTSESFAEALGQKDRLKAVRAYLSNLAHEGVLKVVDLKNRSYVYMLVDLPREPNRAPEKIKARGGYHRMDSGPRSRIFRKGMIAAVAGVVDAAREEARQTASQPDSPKPLSQRLLELAVEAEAMELELAALRSQG